MPPDKLSEKDFLAAIKLAPLISIDLIVWNFYNQVLVGERINRPAQGFWFVPGGRIYKDERIADAFKRITEGELTRIFEISSAQFVGIYEHFYSDNFAGVEGITTHYVVLAFQIVIREDLVHLPFHQHHSYKWMNIEEIIESNAVHQYTKNYFINPNQVIEQQMNSA